MGLSRSTKKAVELARARHSARARHKLVRQRVTVRVAETHPEPSQDEHGPILPNTPERSLFEVFLDSANSHATRKAYQGDVGAFARWLEQTPEEAVVTLLHAGVLRGTELVRRWLEASSNLSVVTRNRRLSTLKTLVRCARNHDLCSWALELSGEWNTAAREVSADSLRYSAILHAMSRLVRNVTPKDLLELLQPEEVSCLRFTKEH